MTAPWAAVLIATALPYRFLQAVFLDQLIEVGANASRYGNLLGATANMIVAAILLALWGRAVYARACRLSMGRGAAPGREAWRVSPAAFASYILTAATAILAGYVTMFTVIGFVVAMMFAGMAIGTMELNERAGVLSPFRVIGRHARTVGIPFALVFVFFCAFFVALVNLGAAFGLGIWLVSAIGGFDAPRWHVLFSAGNRRYILALCMGAVVLLEPFWVAAHVVYVRKSGAEESGDDLRAWFAELRRTS